MILSNNARNGKTRINKHKKIYSNEISLCLGYIAGLFCKYLAFFRLHYNIIKPTRIIIQCNSFKTKDDKACDSNLVNIKLIMSHCDSLTVLIIRESQGKTTWQGRYKIIQIVLILQGP